MFPEIDRLRSLKVGDVMNKHVVEVSAHQTMEEVAQQFMANKISSAPVIDEQGRCVGMLSAADYLRRDCAGVEQGGSLTRDEAGDLRITTPDDAVSRFMAAAVQSVAADAPLLDAARIMCTTHVHRLPVLENERVVGIVSTMDIVAALINAVDEADANQA